jgi:hypothetical protein
MGHYFVLIFFYGRDRPRPSNFWALVRSRPFPDRHCNSSYSVDNFFQKILITLQNEQLSLEITQSI